MKTRFLTVFIALSLIFSACGKDDPTPYEEDDDEVAMVPKYTSVDPDNNQPVYEYQGILPSEYDIYGGKIFNNVDVEIQKGISIHRDNDGNGSVYIQFSGEVETGVYNLVVKYNAGVHVGWTFYTRACAGKEIFLEFEKTEDIYQYGSVSQVRFDGEDAWIPVQDVEYVDVRFFKYGTPYPVPENEFENYHVYTMEVPLIDGKGKIDSWDIGLSLPWGDEEGKFFTKEFEASFGLDTLLVCQEYTLGWANLSERDIELIINGRGDEYTITGAIDLAPFVKGCSELPKYRVTFVADGVYDENGNLKTTEFEVELGKSKKMLDGEKFVPDCIYFLEWRVENVDGPSVITPDENGYTITGDITFYAKAGEEKPSALKWNNIRYCIVNNYLTLSVYKNCSVTAWKLYEKKYLEIISEIDNGPTACNEDELYYHKILKELNSLKDKVETAKASRENLQPDICKAIQTYNAYDTDKQFSCVTNWEDYSSAMNELIDFFIIRENKIITLCNQEEGYLLWQNATSIHLDYEIGDPEPITDPDIVRKYSPSSGGNYFYVLFQTYKVDCNGNRIDALDEPIVVRVPTGGNLNNGKTQEFVDTTCKYRFRIVYQGNAVTNEDYVEYLGRNISGTNEFIPCN